MSFSARIRQLRDEKGLSVPELAHRAGLATGYISKLERAEEIPSCPALEKLAEAFEVPLFKLFYDRVPPATPCLTPRPRLEECLADGTPLESQPGFLETLKVIWGDLGSLLL